MSDAHTPADRNQTDANQGRAGLSRRQFLHASAMASAGLMTTSLGSTAYAQGSDKLRIGLIGCGGRGTGAAIDHLQGNDNVELVALGDLFEDQLNNAKNKLEKQPNTENAPFDKSKLAYSEDTCFVGWDAYKKVIDSEVDVVLMATPPHFRPKMLRAAVDAGKHVFMEKPVCVDPVGARHVIESGKKADKTSLSIVAGTQRRHDKGYEQTIQAIKDGAIGDVRGGVCYWDGGELWYHDKKSEWSEMEYQIRNWLYYTWLSGDHVTEQHVHNLDVMNWAVGRPPKSCLAIGGRMVRTGDKWGEIFDHFGADLDYGDGVHVHSQCRQWDGATRRVSERVTGAKGYSDPSGWVEVDGKRKEFESGRNPYVQEHIDLVDSIRSNEPLNEAERVAESCLTAVMIRMSAYTGQQVSWEWIRNASELDLSPDQYAFGPAPKVDVAHPGETKLT